MGGLEVGCRIRFCARQGHLDVFLEQELNHAIRRLRAAGRTGAGQLIHGGGDGLGRQRGIQPLQRRARSGRQHHIALRLAQQRAGLAKDNELRDLLKIFERHLRLQITNQCLSLLRFKL